MTDVDKAIRAAKLTLGAVLDKRRAQTAKDRAGGQIAPSKYLPGVPRQFHANGGDATMTPAQIKEQMELSEDGGQKAQAALDAINSAGRIGNVAGRLSGIPLGGIFGRRVAEEIAAQGYADGGNVSDARATFLAGNHPEVPDVLYHGTTPKIARKGWTDEIDHEQTQRNIDTHDFREFKPSEYGNYGPGIYLTDHPETANEYAMGIRAGQKEPQPHGQVMKLHVGMKQPFTDRVLRNQAWKDYIKGALTKYYLPHGEDRSARDAILKALDNDTLTVRSLFLTDTPEGTMVNQQGQHEIHDTIRRSGFDGIIAHRPDGSREFVAFKPEQVKSAVGNRGTFDPTNPDMTYADGGSVTDNENFQNWFGNSVTHTNGEPHVFYTGTSKDNDFTSHNVGRHGAWFTRDPAEASSYAEQNDSQGYKRDGWNMVKTNTASRVIPAYVKAENPYTGELPEEYLRDNYKAAQSDWFDTLRAKGHDAWMPASQNGNLVVALKEPQQIKSIFNNGKFDPKQKHMNKADGGSVDDEDEGVDAYHGSPHDFDAFDISKLGTGEGAQSYGHGLYFAGNEGVAKSYRKALSDTLIHPEGTPDLEKRAGQMALTFSDNTPEGALQWLSKFKNGATHTSPAMTPELVEAVSKRFSSGEFRPGGHMYKVRLRVKPHELLDWDKPMSQQHPNVQAAIKAIGVDTGAREWKTGANLGNGNRLIVTPHPDLPDDEQFSKYEMETPVGARIKLHRQDVERLLGKGGDLTGGQVHQRLIDMGNRDGAIGEHLRADNPMKTGPKWAAEALMRHGIKGIRYRDAMSRNKEDGDATHNYVMFHHDPVKVVDKYEYGGAVDGEDEGLDAYHGSPHDFDEFDIAHLGTGEGAQAYGHGLYFAGNEGIAKHYKNVLSTRNKVHPDDEAVQKFLPHSAEIQRRKAALSGTDGLISLDTGSDELDAIGADEEKLHRMMIADTVRRKPHLQYGRMYKVKLNVKPHELLDWDKPLSEQHPNIQRIAREADISKAVGPTRGVLQAWREGRDVGVKATGRDLHQAISGYGEHGKQAADYLQSQGLKGIRYLDAGSRDISDGDPTHNYVMFHHDPVKVVDKYEYGGRVAKGGGGSMGDDESRPVDLGVTRALRRFNQNSDGPTPEAEGVFDRLAAGRDAAAEAHDAAIKDGVFNNVQIGDVYKYKPTEGSTPMKVVDHGMVHISRWGGINPPKYVYQDHFPVAEMQVQDASKERRKYPIELMEDRNRYDFLSGKPRVARKDGGRLDLYSKAARIIRGMKDQKMDVADILKYATGKGAKKTEIAHVDVPPGKATPSQVAEHIEFMQPQVGVHKREMFYRYRDPEQYERQINYLEGQGRYDEAEELNREFEAFEGYGGKDAPLYAKYQLPGGENYREHVLTLDSHPDDQTYTAPIHWGKLKNPLAHIRMSDRMIGNKKILHIEELQSDWNNDARKVGFRTGREKQDYEDYVAQMRQKAIDKVKARTGQDYYDPMTGETAPTMSPMVAQAQIEKYQRMDPYTLALKMGMHDEHRRMADAAKGGSGVPRAPYINPDKDDAAELAMKHVLMEAAKGGYDGIAFTPDEEQELRWPGHTFKGIYNKRLPGIAQRLVQPHDLDTDTDDMTHLNGWAVPMIPLSDKARDSITQNGFSSFRRGGMVGYEDGGSVTPDIQNPMSIFPKPQRMFPEDQRPAGGQYLSMPSKTDVTGHKAEAATIGVAPGGKPFFRASQNAVDQTGSTGRGTATAKTNLFKQKAGWRWAQAPEGHEATDTIVSVEHRGKHYYTLNAHFPKGVDLARYENAPSEPRLRPTTRGNVETGPQAGSILVRGREHPVYHHVIVKAGGGAVDAALAATRRFTKDGQHVTMRLKD